MPWRLDAFAEDAIGDELYHRTLWYNDHFAIEYKGPDGNLSKAYRQLSAVPRIAGKSAAVDRQQLPDHRQVRLLFRAMAEGDSFGEHQIRYFDGGLFDDDSVLDMDSPGVAILHGIT